MSHNLCWDYNRTYEQETEKRDEILKKLLGSLGEGAYFQGPIFFNYGIHTHIGQHLFANYNLTVLDDGEVWIGDDVLIGPNCTLGTPAHPLLAEERRGMYRMGPKGEESFRPCYAKPIHIGNDVWLASCVVVCGGVTIGDGSVIGAGSVVTRDIPPNVFAGGNPCRVIRPITQEDRIPEWMREEPADEKSV